MIEEQKNTVIIISQPTAPLRRGNFKIMEQHKMSTEIKFIDLNENWVKLICGVYDEEISKKWPHSTVMLRLAKETISKIDTDMSELVFKCTIYLAEWQLACALNGKFIP